MFKFFYVFVLILCINIRFEPFSPSRLSNNYIFLVEGQEESLSAPDDTFETTQDAESKKNPSHLGLGSVVTVAAIKNNGNGKSQGGSEVIKYATGGPALKKAMEEWSSSLIPETDYNETHWLLRFKSKAPQDYFEAYNKRLSDVFAKHGAMVNFVLIGACDGTNDKTIRLKYDHFNPSLILTFTFTLTE